MMAGINIETADKDQLVELAKTEYQVTIDPRTKIETIRERVQGLVSGISPAIIAKDVAPPSVVDTGRYVKSLINGNVYAFQDYLVGADFIACDSEGNTV